MIRGYASVFAFSWCSWLALGCSGKGDSPQDTFGEDSTNGSKTLDAKDADMDSVDVSDVDVDQGDLPDDSAMT